MGIEDNDTFRWLQMIATVFALVVIGLWLYGSWVDASKVTDEFKPYSIGTGVSAKFIEGNLVTMSKTQIETTKGTYLVSGPFSVTKDNPLLITLKGINKQICDTVEKRCAFLVGD